MTIAELNAKLKELADASKFDDAIILAANDTKDFMAERIFEKSENVSGKIAGSSDYSTKELWVEPLTLPRNAGSATGKRGKEIKTRYFAQGWKQVKSEVGRPNYELTGVLRSDFSSQLTTITSGVVELRLKSTENVGKVKGLNVKYGKTFATNKAERDNYKAVLKFEVLKILNK